MPKFSVQCHIENRMISFGLKQVLDATIGEAVRIYGNAQQANLDTTAQAVVNACHSGIDGAMDYHVKGRQFAGWDVLTNFMIKQIKDETNDNLNAAAIAGMTGEQERQIMNFVVSEAVALAKALFVPKPGLRH